jgi:hypothetical protein
LNLVSSSRFALFDNPFCGKIVGNIAMEGQVLPSSGSPHPQVSHADQIISRNSQGEVSGELLGASLAGFS